MGEKVAMKKHKMKGKKKFLSDTRDLLNII